MVEKVVDGDCDGVVEGKHYDGVEGTDRLHDLVTVDRHEHLELDRLEA